MGVFGIGDYRCNCRECEWARKYFAKHNAVAGETITIKKPARYLPPVKYRALKHWVLFITATVLVIVLDYVAVRYVAPFLAGPR